MVNGFDIATVNKELQEVYKKWWLQVNIVAPELFGDKDYSNPYYIGIPMRWYSSNVRIMIVGEQGFGYEGNGKEDGIAFKDIPKLQARNVDQFNYETENPHEGQHPFWDRARKVRDLGYPCTWTFIDKICWRRDRRSKLSDDMRNKLHSVDIRVLAEEIRILKPTHVFFFGWHGTSIKHELPEISKKLYPNGEWDDSIWENYYCFEEQDGIKFLFSYSPHSPYWKDKPADYEERLMAEFTKSVGGKNPNPPVKDNRQKKGNVDKLDEIKRLPDIQGFRKSCITIMTIWIIVSIVLLIIIPPVGIIGLVLAPVLGLLNWLGYRGKIKNYVKNPHLIEECRNRANSINTANINNSNAPRTNKVQRAAVNAAASYGVGKVTQTAIKQTNTYKNLARNPYTEKNNVNTNSRQTNSRTQHEYNIEYRLQVCATCEHWCGERKSNYKSNGTGVKCSSAKVTGQCKKPVAGRRATQANNSGVGCKNYLRWSALKK